MVSLPTAAQTGDHIKAFYAAHAQLIVAQQLLGVVTLLPFVLFGLALGAGHRRWLMLAVVLLVIAELFTNIIPVTLLLTNASADSAHGFTVVEDLADAALFVTIAIFTLVATSGEPGWVRGLGWVVAGLSVFRAVLSPLGAAALDALAPLAFLIIVVILSVRLMRGSYAASG